MSGDQPNPTQFMARALDLARLGTWSTHPNPAVGCVLVNNGQVIGEGYHIRAGENHAEVNALVNAREKSKDTANSNAQGNAGFDVKGSTAYVTLEPCSFAGRTPACVGKLIEAGIAEVQVAMLDPDPRNAGAGVKMLKEAGIKVEVGLLADEARKLNPGHVKRHEQGMPWVRLKLAMTMDGKTALASGESKWITCEESRLDVQRLRARSSALVTGVQTVIDDNPSLMFRADGLVHPHLDAALAAPRQIFVLDTNGRIPPASQVLQQTESQLVTVSDAKLPEAMAGKIENLQSGRARPHSQVLQQSQTLLVTGPDAKLPDEIASKIEILQVATSDNRISLVPFLQLLAQREHSEVLFECGATLAGALLAENLVDELVLYIAPTFMGAGATNSPNRSLLNLPEIDRMADLVRFNIVDLQQVGADVRVTMQPQEGD